MLNISFKKVTSYLMIGMVSATLISPNIVFGSDTNVSGQATNNQNQTPLTAKNGVSVHDPSIVKDNDTYYIFGSHIEAAKSTDLQNWTRFSNGYTATGNVLFGDLSSNLAKSFAWAGQNDVDSKGGYSVWGPTVFWNADFVNVDGSNGAYMMYYCTSSTYKRSAIGYAVSQNIEGPYTNVDTIMYSGFTKEDAHDTGSNINTKYTNTNIQDLMSSSKLTGANDKWFTSAGQYNTSYAPNAIDPELFYGTDGKLYMTYGSWSGGIYILEVDKATGKPVYPGADVENVSGNITDRYFGTRISGGYGQSGEGAKVVYDSVTGYYYLYETYGFLSADGGYNMRLFKSQNPTGPYVDASGNNAALTSDASNTNKGIKLIGNYKFDCLSVGYKSAGHNSAFMDSDGQRYIIYHTRFNTGTEEHQVRVHQMFMNEDGWPVIAPYEYSGDKISSTGYSNDDVVGYYQLINHGSDNSPTMLDTLNIKLNADFTISGDVNGTWSMTAGSCYMNVIANGITYKGVFFKQQDESQYDSKVMTFSAIGDNNESIWGSKLSLTDANATEYAGRELANIIPSSTKIDLTLPTTGAYDSTISWSSSNPAVLSTNGVVTRTGQDESITLTATITKGTATFNKTFTVVVKGILNFNGAPIYKYNFNTSDGTDKIVNVGSKGVSSNTSAALIGSAVIADDVQRGKILSIKTPTKTLKTNYLNLPTNTFSQIIDKGYTVSMWVNYDNTAPNYSKWSSLFEATANNTFPMTKMSTNLVSRINANGAYADSDEALLTPNTWQYVTYTVGTKGIVIYVNGIEIKRIDKDLSSCFANNSLSNINDVRVGSGDIWGDTDIASARFDNVAIYNSALTDQEVEGLYTKELLSDSDQTITDTQAIDYAANDLNSIIPTSTSVNLTLPTTGAYDTTISWSSNNITLLNNDGVIKRTGHDEIATLTATITKGQKLSTKTFLVTVQGELTNLDIAPTYKYNFNTNDLSNKIANVGNVTLTTGASATLIGSASIIDDETRGKVLSISNKNGAVKSNYLALPSSTFSGITGKGYTVSMWANVDTTNSNYWQHSALFEATKDNDYPMTRIGANLITRINSNGGYADSGITAISPNTWQYVTYTVDSQGLSVYVNGTEVSSVSKDLTNCFTNDFLSNMNDVRVGSGSIWNDRDISSAKFDNVAFYNISLTSQEVEALYNQETNSSPSEKPAINSIVITPTNVTVAHGKSIQLTAIVDVVGEANETVDWSSNDTNSKVTVDQNGIVSVAADAGLGDYEITAVSTFDHSKSGKSNIKVINSSETQADTDVLTITKQPSNQTVITGRTASFSVDVTGKSPFSYQWRKNEINLRDINRISGTNKANITIENVVESDAGKYDCVITDMIGTVTTSSAVTLTVMLTSSSSSNNPISSSSSSTSSSSSNSSSNNSRSSSINSSKVVATVTVNNDITAIQNAFKTSGIKTIIINLTDVQPSDTNQIPVLSQDIILDLRTNIDKTLVIKTIDSTIEIKGKDGQIQFTQNGIAITGFKLIGTSEYYLDSNGIMQIGWVQSHDSTWYYLDKSTGIKTLNWIQETNGTWYYLDKVSGSMKTGWIQETNGTWYYLDRLLGAMKTGWIQDNEKWYFLYSTGSLATSTNIDGYAVNENGEWVK